MNDLAREVNETLHERFGEEARIKGDSRIRALLASLNKTLFEKIKTIIANAKSEKLSADTLATFKEYDAQSHKDKVFHATHVQSLRVSWYHYNSFAFFRFLIDTVFEQLSRHSLRTRRECAEALSPYSIAIEKNSISGTLPRWMIDALQPPAHEVPHTEDSNAEAAIILASHMAEEPAAASPATARPKRKAQSPRPYINEAVVAPPPKRAKVIFSRQDHAEMPLVAPRLLTLLNRYRQFGHIEALQSWEDIMDESYEQLSKQFPLDRVTFDIASKVPPPWFSPDHALFKIDPSIRVPVIESGVRRGATFAAIFVDTATEEGSLKFIMSSSLAPNDDAESDFDYNETTRMVTVSIDKIPDLY